MREKIKEILQSKGLLYSYKDFAIELKNEDIDFITEEIMGIINASDVGKRYFLVRKYNSGTTADKTDIIGLTTNEEYAKNRQSVFCGYEEVKLIP